MPFDPPQEPTPDESDEYDKVFEIMTDALQKIADARVSRLGMLPAVTDFLTAIALIVAGEDGVRGVTQRMEGRIDDWKAGLFPAANDR